MTYVNRKELLLVKETPRAAKRHERGTSSPPVIPVETPRVNRQKRNVVVNVVATVTMRVEGKYAWTNKARGILSWLHFSCECVTAT